MAPEPLHLVLGQNRGEPVGESRAGPWECWSLALRGPVGRVRQVQKIHLSDAPRKANPIPLPRPVAVLPRRLVAWTGAFAGAISAMAPAGTVARARANE